MGCSRIVQNSNSSLGDFTNDLYCIVSSVVEERSRYAVRA